MLAMLTFKTFENSIKITNTGLHFSKKTLNQNLHFAWDFTQISTAQTKENSQLSCVLSLT